MRYVLSVVALLLCVVLALSAARPFDRVAADDNSYDHLTTIVDGGLLDDFIVPEGELSRLEFAVLVQKGLGQYGNVQLTGFGTEAAVEAAFDILLTEFADEIAQLGGYVEMPSNNAVGVSDLEYRVSHLEEEVDDFYVPENETYEYAECTCGECDVEDAIELTMYGDFDLQLRSECTAFVEEGSDSSNSTDLDLYWGELGFDATDGTWSGHFSVLFDDYADDIVTHEFYGRYDCPKSDMYMQVGRSVLPFGNNAFYFPTYPASNDLGYTTADAIGLGFDATSYAMSAWFFNPNVSIGDEENDFSDYSFVWDITKREADECTDGYQLTAGYTSVLGEHDIRLAGDSLVDRTAGYNLFGRYDWAGNKYHLLADYTAAAEEYAMPAAASSLDGNADGIGDIPTAMNVEFVYEPQPEMLWGFAYQATDEMVNYAETRYGFMYGERLSPLAMLKLEFTHGEYGNFGTMGKDTDDTFVAEVNLSF